MPAGEEQWWMNFMGFIPPLSALEEKAFKRNSRPLCILLLALLMTLFEFSLLFFLVSPPLRSQKNVRRSLSAFCQEKKCSHTALVQWILFYLTIKIKVPGLAHHAGLSHYPFPYLDHVEFWQKGSKLSTGRQHPLPSWIPSTLRHRKSRGKRERRREKEEACWVSPTCPFWNTHTSLLNLKGRTWSRMSE